MPGYTLNVNGEQKRVERRDRAVNLATAVVGDDDPSEAELRGAARVVGMQDALEQHREVGAAAQGRDVVPRERGT